MKVRLQHLPVQADFYKCTDEFVAFVAGVGYGKTHGAADWILTRAANFPQARHFIFSNTYTQLIGGTLKTFFERCDAWGLKYVSRIHMAEKAIHLPELGATIEVRSADKPINYKSLEYSSAWIDEAQAWKRETYERVIERKRGTAIARRLYPGMSLDVRITANPPHNMDHWLVELCTQPLERTGKPAITLFTATTFDNPFLPQSYIESMLDQYDPELVQIELYGKFGDIGRGRIWRRFSRARHIITPERAIELGLPPLEWEPTLPVCWSHDFNIDPLSSILFQWRTVHATGYMPVVMYVLDEMRIRSALIDDAVKEFQNREASKIARKSGLILYGDPAGNQGNRQTGISDWVALTQGLERAGFRGNKKVPAAPPRLRDRYNAGNARLENGRGLIGTVINPRCTFLPKDLERMYYKPGTSEPFVPPAKDGVATNLITHLADAWSYPIAYEYPIIDAPDVHVRSSQ